MSRKLLYFILLIKIKVWAITINYINFGSGLANVEKMKTDSAALMINLSHQYNPSWAIDGGYSYLIPQKLSPNHVTTYPNQSLSYIAAKFIVPFSPIFNSFVKIGAGIGLISNKTITPAPYMGIGGNLKLNQNWSFNVEENGLIVLDNNNNNGNVSILALELQYKF